MSASSKREAIPVGIDLGTTYSVIARLDDRGRPETIVNAEGDRSTPSVVLFEGSEVIVGREAVKAMATEADAVATCAKRDLGDRVFHKVLGGQQYSPEVIEAFVLNKLRQDAQQQIGRFAKVVITVPAYFDEVRRKATQDAGYMAGLDVIDIINEPTAAAVAFGYQEGFLDAEGTARRDQRILVYDLGGGTFDVTLMELRGREFVALATDGDVQLGGYDWDQRLVDMTAEVFIREYGIDPRDDACAAGRLWQACEEAKRTLSNRGRTTILFDYRGFTTRLDITREQFEAATQDLLDRTRFTAVQTLKAAGLDWPDIDRVLLTGGSTRMPMVRAMLKNLTGREPDTSVSADEAVAHGAALHAGLLIAKSQGKPTTFKIRNVNSHSLGVVGIDRLTNRRRNGIVIPRNTRLPVTAKRTFKTHKPGQQSIKVEIIEGESPSADDCNPLGKCAVSNLPPNMPAQTPVHVLFHYQPNGRLKVKVSVAESQQEVETEIVRENGLSKEHLDGWRTFIAKAPLTDYK